MDTIPDRLLAARRARGLSRRALSIAAGLSPAVVGKIERGDLRNPGSTTLSRIAAALGVPSGWLLTGEEPAPFFGTAADGHPDGGCAERGAA